MEKLLLNVLDQLFIEIESSASDVLFHKPLLYKVVGCLKKAESTVYANASLSPDLQIAAQSSNFFSDSHESDVVLTDCCSYGWRTGHQSENVIFQKYGFRKNCPRNGDKQLTAIVYWKAVLGSYCYTLLNTEYMYCNLLHLLRKKFLNDSLYIKSWWIQKDYIWHFYNFRKKRMYWIQHLSWCFVSLPVSGRF